MRIFLILAVLTPALLFATEYELTDELPFSIGESLTFSVKALGIYLADQITTLDELTTYDGMTAIKGTVTLANSGVAAKLYFIDDEETTYFTPDTLAPIYYEKRIHEGKWENNQKFDFMPGEAQFKYYSEKAGSAWTTVDASAELRNYLTMVLLLRALDYDYYIGEAVPIKIDYLFDVNVTSATFTASYSTMKYQRKRIDVIYLEDTAGLGFEVTLSADENRLPLKVVIPPYDNSGVSVDFVAELIDYELGD